MQDISAKIAAIIAKADSTSHPEEAALFMAKAHQLLEKHGMNLLDLGKLAEDAIGVDRRTIRHSSAYGWMVDIADAMCAYYGVKFNRTRMGNEMVYSIGGRQSARVTFSLMLPFIQRQVMNIARHAFNRGEYKNRMNAAANVGRAVAARIWDMAPDQKKNEGVGVNALVPVDLIEQLMRETFPHAKEPRTKKARYDSNAANLAKQINLNPQTGSNAAPKQLQARSK